MICGDLVITDHKGQMKGDPETSMQLDDCDVSFLRWDFLTVTHVPPTPLIMGPQQIYPEGPIYFNTMCQQVDQTTTHISNSVRREKLS